MRGLLCFILGLAFGSPPCGGLSPAGADRMRFCAPASLRRGAQCAPARVGRPACIRFENGHDVEAKSALSRNTLGGIPRPLPCFSSPNGTRWAGLPFGAACGGLSPQGRIGCVSLRRGAQCAPARAGRPTCIRFKNGHVVEAKSALSRNALAGIPRPLPCFSSPNGIRWAGLPFGGRLRRLIPRPA